MVGEDGQPPDRILPGLPWCVPGKATPGRYVCFPTEENKIINLFLSKENADLL
jgi:hypothetical protein